MKLINSSQPPVSKFQCISIVTYGSGSQTAVRLPVVVGKGLHGGTGAGLISVCL